MNFRSKFTKGLELIANFKSQFLKIREDAVNFRKCFQKSISVTIKKNIDFLKGRGQDGETTFLEL